MSGGLHRCLLEKPVNRSPGLSPSPMGEPRGIPNRRLKCSMARTHPGWIWPSPCATRENCGALSVILVVVVEPVVRRGASACRLFPALLPSERGQIEIVVCPVEDIDPARGRRVRVKDILALAQEDTHPTILAAVRRGMEVVIEVAAIRGEPRNGPAHPRLERLNLLQRRSRDKHQRGIAGMEMGQMADIVNQ